jgi:Tol biopolymer transport system component
MKVVATRVVVLFTVALAAASALSEGCGSPEEQATSSPPPNTHTAPSTSSVPAATPTPQTVSATELSGAPSGSLLFEPNQTCVSSVYTVKPDGSGRTTLTDSVKPNTLSGLSPDGKLLAYVSSGHSDPEEDGIYVASADGSNPRPVATGEAWQFVSWSPTGKILYAKPDTVGIDLAGYDYWIVNPDGSDPSLISQMNRCDDPVGWSPHSDGLLLCQCAWDRAWMAPHSCSLSVVDETGRAIRTIIPAGDAVFSSPRWSPDGSHILFVQSKNGGWGQAVVMDADGSNQRVVLGSMSDLMSSVGKAEWSPDGTEIAARQSWQITVVSAASGELRATIKSGGGDFPSLAWSPDGKKLLYGGAEVHVVDASGTTGEVVIKGAEQASWSPDGSQIVFTSSARDCKWYVWWISPDGSKRGRLAETAIRVKKPTPEPSTTGAPSFPVFEGAGPVVRGAVGGCDRGPEKFSCLSPDRASEAVVDNGTLRIVDRASGQTREVQLDGASAWDQMPVWSSDGGRIALYVKTDKDVSLFTVDVGTGQVESIAADVAPSRGSTPLIAWSPDDSYVYYVKEADCMQGGCSPGFLYRVHPDGSGEQRVVDMYVEEIYGFKP